MVRTFPKFNRKIVETGINYFVLRDRSLSRLGAGNSIGSGGVKLHLVVKRCDHSSVFHKLYSSF